jgi:hypothetical protein
VSTYREIVGKKIKKVSADPSSGTEGEMWYNSTTGTLRGPAILSAWTSGGPLISIQGDMAHLGTQTASLCAGGADNPTAENTNITQEGNGTGFSLGGNLNTERRGCAGFGVQTSAVCFGGYTTTYDNNTEEYNGTAWTNGNDTPLSPGTASWASGGTLTAGLGYGGSDLGPGATPPANRGKQTIEYDGTNWADGNQMTRSSGDGINGFGIQTAALAAGQSTPPGSPSATTVVENYDGTNWTSGTVTPTGVAYGGSGGTQTAGIIFGGVSDGSPGYPTKVTTTLSWDGTSWSSEPALATARHGTWGGPVGSSTASQLMGGNNGSSMVTNVENFDSSTTAVTAGAWAAGGNLSTARRTLSGAGTQTAALAMGGYAPPNPTASNASEEYDGSSWTAGGTMGDASYYGSGFGSQTAAVNIDGDGTIGSAPYPAATEEYDGSSWTAGGNVNNPAYGIASFGTLTAGVKATGHDGTAPTNKAEEYNGTAWTEVNTTPTTGYGMMGGGTQTAGLYRFGREGPPSTPTPYTNSLKSSEYDGTNWTTGGTGLVARRNISGGGGTQTASWVGGGYLTASTDSNYCESYDGTSWATMPTLGTARYSAAGATQSPSSASLIFGGSTPGNTAATEEFTAATSTANIENFTTS